MEWVIDPTYAMLGFPKGDSDLSLWAVGSKATSGNPDRLSPKLCPPFRSARRSRARCARGSVMHRRGSHRPPSAFPITCTCTCSPHPTSAAGPSVPERGRESRIARPQTVSSGWWFEPCLASHAGLELEASPSLAKISLSCFSRTQFFTVSDRLSACQQ